MCGELLWNRLINIAANPWFTDEQSYFSKSPVGVEVSDSLAVPLLRSGSQDQWSSVAILGQDRCPGPGLRGRVTSNQLCSRSQMRRSRKY